MTLCTHIHISIHKYIALKNACQQIFSNSRYKIFFVHHTTFIQSESWMKHSIANRNPAHNFITFEQLPPINWRQYTKTRSQLNGNNGNDRKKNNLFMCEGASVCDEV